LLEISPKIEFVQFVDGDCEIAEGWFESAVEFLQSHDDVAAVSGRQHECEPQRNWYHRLAEMEWHSLPGVAKSCGGNACMRTLAFERVGRFRESMIAGEEPELCARLRKAGWRVWRLDQDMAWHDIRMNRFSQWWRRALRAGYAYMEGFAIHGSLRSLQEVHRTKKVCSIWFWALLPVVAAVLAWPTRGYSLVVLFALYLLLYTKIFRYRLTVHQDTAPNARLYAVACVVAKWPEAIGSLTYLWRRLTRSSAQIIEYRSKSSRDIVSPDLSTR